MAVHGEKRFVSVTLEFEYREDPGDPDYTERVLTGMSRQTDMSDDELEALGETIGQSDTWQVTNWNHIQSLLGDPSVTSINPERRWRT